ncbi:hypothetical protein [Rhizobium sp. RCAM05973]|uniref:hypothetical protein n=1 Tax=Rhizobium sp. RCAM05973 TaxID=2994066 RepID=UPI0022EBD087|nr:hypothetical protein [Rhizobium sp. RCAM05973]
MMIPVSLSFVSAIAALSLTGCVTTSVDGVKQRPHNQVVTSGKREKIGQSWHLNPDCSVSRLPTARVIEEPQHGKVSVVNQKGLVATAKGQFARCNSLRLPVTAIYYQSAPGYVGSDKLVARVSYGDGYVVDKIYWLRVKK